MFFVDQLVQQVVRRFTRRVVRVTCWLPGNFGRRLWRRQTARAGSPGIVRSTPRPWSQSERHRGLPVQIDCLHVFNRMSVTLEDYAA
jgi:hypothetical protein